MADLKNTNGQIVAGLRADIMRCSMETKNLLTKAGSIYVGTGETDAEHGGAYKTKELQCGATDTILTSTGTDLEYKPITSLLKSDVTYNITVNTANQVKNLTNEDPDDNNHIQFSIGDKIFNKTITDVEYARTAHNVDSIDNDAAEEDAWVSFSIGDSSYSKKVNNVENADYATRAGTVDVSAANAIKWPNKDFSKNVFGLYNLTVYTESIDYDRSLTIQSNYAYKIFNYRGESNFEFILPITASTYYTVTYNGNRWSAIYSGGERNILIDIQLIAAYA